MLFDATDMIISVECGTTTLGHIVKCILNVIHLENNDRQSALDKVKSSFAKAILAYMYLGPEMGRFDTESDKVKYIKRRLLVKGRPQPFDILFISLIYRKCEKRENPCRFSKEAPEHIEVCDDVVVLI